MINKWKAVFGFALLFVIAILSLCIALGKVMQESSYGLQILLGCLTTLSGGFAAWAFGKSSDSDDKPQ